MTTDPSPTLEATRLTDPERTFFKDLPRTAEYGGRSVSEWSSDRVKAYLDQARRGKERVEAHRIRVEPPKLEADSSSESRI